MTMPSSVRSTTHDFTHHGGFQEAFAVTGVSQASVVLASISEIGVINGQLIPFQGAASVSIDNVVPGPGNVIVRGNIGWGTDITVRISILAVPDGLGGPGSS
jgi:hypothetical protein